MVLVSTSRSLDVHSTVDPQRSGSNALKANAGSRPRTSCSSVLLKHKFDCYLEPTYEYNFGRGHEQSLGITVRY
jgi:hypothetical protein